MVYIGCNTGSQPAAMTLMDGFVRAASRTDGSPLTAAAFWRGATRYYFEKERLGELQPTESWYRAGMFFQGMKFMFFGDPTDGMNQNSSLIFKAVFRPFCFFVEYGPCDPIARNLGSDTI